MSSTDLRGEIKADPNIELKDYSGPFNPDIVVKALALPPRKSKDDICCKWEFTYKSK